VNDGSPVYVMHLTVRSDGGRHDGAMLFQARRTVNVIWGFANLVPWELPPPWGLCIAALIGALLMALYLANHFGKVRNSAPHP
jgi:hypothetical protein